MIRKCQKLGSMYGSCETTLLPVMRLFIYGSGWSVYEQYLHLLAHTHPPTMAERLATPMYVCITNSDGMWERIFWIPRYSNVDVRVMRHKTHFVHMYIHKFVHVHFWATECTGCEHTFFALFHLFFFLLLFALQMLPQLLPLSLQILPGQGRSTQDVFAHWIIAMKGVWLLDTLYVRMYRNWKCFTCWQTQFLLESCPKEWLSSFSTVEYVRMYNCTTVEFIWYIATQYKRLSRNTDPLWIRKSSIHLHTTWLDMCNCPHVHSARYTHTVQFRGHLFFFGHNLPLPLLPSLSLELPSHLLCHPVVVCSIVPLPLPLRVLAASTHAPRD